jgi:hypothetical protein
VGDVVDVVQLPAGIAVDQLGNGAADAFGDVVRLQHGGGAEDRADRLDAVTDLLVCEGEDGGNAARVTSR